MRKALKNYSSFEYMCVLKRDFNYLIYVSFRTPIHISSRNYNDEYTEIKPISYVVKDILTEDI